ncbi:MAG: hypothetical protein ACLVIU_14155, partial [Paraclostridium sp.]
VKEITSMNSKLKNDVNTTTGEVKSNWEKLKDWWNNWHPVQKVFSIITRQPSQSKIQGNWTGNSHFKGGLTYLHERGYELYDLPQGTRIYNHESSEQMVLETARQTAQSIASAMLQGTNSNNGDINLNLTLEIDGEKIATKSDKILGRKQNIERRLIGANV